VDFRPGTSEALNRVHEPFDYPRISYERTAEEAYVAVLASAGASHWRDPVDERIVHDVRTGTATFGRNGFIDSQDEVGGWPEIRPAGSPADSDRDGMPDWWEGAHVLNPREHVDGNGDRDSDGYTNLEEYLNWLADPSAHRAAGCDCVKQHPSNARKITAAVVRRAADVPID
jgi:hypothetical protein